MLLHRPDDTKVLLAAETPRLSVLQQLGRLSLILLRVALATRVVPFGTGSTKQRRRHMVVVRALVSSRGGQYGLP